MVRSRYFVPFLSFLDLLPLRAEFCFAQIRLFSKNMGVASDQFFIYRNNNVVKREPVLLVTYLREHHDQVEEIPEFLAQVGVVTVVDCVDYFAKFFMEIFFEGVHRLFTVPWASIRSAQLSNSLVKQLK